MKLLSLELENFLSFGRLYYEFTAQGLVSLEGPPGVGKSSFLDGVSYVLFNQISKNISVEEIINRKAGRNLFAKLRLEYQGKEYAVVRTRKHSQYGNDAWIEIDGAQNRGKDARETDKLILQMFDLNYDIFQKSSYFSQFSKIDAFLSSSDTAKKELISDIGGLQKYDVVLEKAKRIALDIENNAMMINSKLMAAQSAKNTLEQTLRNTEASHDKWEVDQKTKIDQLVAASNQFELYKTQQLQDLERSCKSFDDFQLQTISKLCADKEIFEGGKLTRIGALENQIKSLKEQRVGVEAQIFVFPNEPARGFESEREELRKKLTLIRELDQKKSKMMGDISFHQRSLDQKKSKANAERLKIAAGAPSNCGHCHQTISAEMILSQVKTIEDTFAEDNVAIEQLQKNIAAIDQGIAQRSVIEASITKINEEESAYRLTLAKNDQFRSQLQSIDNDITSKEKQIYLIEQEQNPFDAKIEIEKAKQNPYKAMIETKKGEPNTYLARIEETKAEKNPFAQQRWDQNDQLQQKINAVNEIQAVVAAEQEKLKYAKWWKEAFGVYIRSYLMDSFIQQINQKANEYLETLFDGMLQLDIQTVTESGKELKEKIHVSIFNGGDECSYDSLSGGERCRICLSVNLAISDLARSTSQSNLNILMIDEAFNGLNEEGKNQTMKLLKELEERFDTIFVIDHTETFKSQFTNRITVEKREGYSILLH